MAMDRKVRLLVVDDSPLFRKSIERILKPVDWIDIVGFAADPQEAREQIVAKNPDVLTCDVEMPLMDGIEFIKWLLPQHFVPVVMVSSLTSKVFEAMRAGAVDFVPKPGSSPNQTAETFGPDLIAKIRAASAVKGSAFQQAGPTGSLRGQRAGGGKGSIIAIGASTGGTEAIYRILAALPPTMPGIVIVQHIPPVFSRLFAERLNEQTALKVKEATTGDILTRGSVLIAPGDRHMTVKKVQGNYRVECREGAKVNGHCPSVDVLFESVAQQAGNEAIGILLTGMGYDGAKGLLSIRRRGGRTIGQDESSSVVYGMPQVAKNIGAVEIQASLDAVPHRLISLLK